MKTTVNSITYKTVKCISFYNLPFCLYKLFNKREKTQKKQVMMRAASTIALKAYRVCTILTAITEGKHIYKFNQSGNDDD